MYKFKLFREFNLYDLERATFHFNKLKKGTIYE